MPQLLPAPWFLVFTLTWLVFITLAPKKILSHSLLNEPTSSSTKNPKHTWTWLW